MNKYKDFVYKVSAVLILSAAVLYLFLPFAAAWIMAVSVIAFSVATALSPYPGKSIRGKRLFNFQLISCLLMFAAVYFMFQYNNVWILAMLAAAIFLLYAAIFIPKELKKDGFDSNEML